jgi:hypothetical protein
LQLTELGNGTPKHKNKRRKLDTHPRETKNPKSKTATTSCLRGERCRSHKLQKLEIVRVPIRQNWKREENEMKSHQAQLTLI